MSTDTNHRQSLDKHNHDHIKVKTTRTIPLPSTRTPENEKRSRPSRGRYNGRTGTAGRPFHTLSHKDNQFDSEHLLKNQWSSQRIRKIRAICISFSAMPHCVESGNPHKRVQQSLVAHPNSNKLHARGVTQANLKELLIPATRQISWLWYIGCWCMWANGTKGYKRGELFLSRSLI